MSEEKKFDRGTSLTIFASDRHEDFFALALALIIAVGVVLVVGR